MDTKYNVNFIGEFFSTSVVVTVTANDMHDKAVEVAEELLRSQYGWEVRPVSKIAIEVEEWV